MIMNINKSAESDKSTGELSIISEQMHVKIDDDFASLFKFNKIENKESNPNFFGDLSQNTPLNRNDKYGQMSSFNIKNTQQIFEIKKANQITEVLMPKLFYNSKTIESIIDFLGHLKQIFKPQKLTFFVLDQDYQKMIFRGDRK